MKYKLNYEMGDCSDSVVVEAETVEEVVVITFAEMKKRGWLEEYCWSEKI